MGGRVVCALISGESDWALPLLPPERGLVPHVGRKRRMVPGVEGVAGVRGEEGMLVAPPQCSLPPRGGGKRGRVGLLKGLVQAPGAPLGGCGRGRECGGGARGETEGGENALPLSPAPPLLPAALPGAGGGSRTGPLSRGPRGERALLPLDGEVAGRTTVGSPSLSPPELPPPPREKLGGSIVEVELPKGVGRGMRPRGRRVVRGWMGREGKEERRPLSLSSPSIPPQSPRREREAVGRKASPPLP